MSLAETLEKAERKSNELVGRLILNPDPALRDLAMEVGDLISEAINTAEAA